MAARLGRPPVSRTEFFNKISNYGRHRTFFISPVRVAEEMGISSRTVRRMLKDLESDGMIKYQYREGNFVLVYSVVM
jgi:Mn-dependent DtxR family transcriptional regulator